MREDNERAKGKERTHTERRGRRERGEEGERIANSFQKKLKP